MAKKKDLTIKQKVRKYRAIQWTTFFSQYICIASPYVVLGIINWDKWFATNPHATEVGIGGGIAMVLVGVITLLVTNAKKEDIKINMYIPLIMGWLLFATIFWLVGSIIMEISNIMYICTTGLAGALGIDILSSDAKKKKEHFLKSLNLANDELDKEQARYEIEQEKRKKNIW